MRQRLTQTTCGLLIPRFRNVLSRIGASTVSSSWPTRACGKSLSLRDLIEQRFSLIALDMPAFKVPQTGIVTHLRLPRK
ncbi:hypothetical protein KC333_g202 [Hortaea werneckii]|nr:hypothetical protein KC333_g202 [Hortaea werneckii]